MFAHHHQFTKIVCALTHSEIGEAKYNIAPAISSAFSRYFIGVCAKITFSISGVKTKAVVAQEHQRLLYFCTKIVS